MNVCDFWMCPTCKFKYWMLWGRTKVVCAHCGTRCIPIPLKTWALPVPKRHGVAQILFTDNDDPEDTNV